MELNQFNGSFYIKGQVVGLNAESLKQGTIEKGICKGKKFKSIKFKVKTSENNTIPVELFGMEQDQVSFYNRQEKKTIKVDWSKMDLTPKNGYVLIVPSYVMVQNIFDTISDDDFISVNGRFDFQEYTADNGTTYKTTKYTIKSIKKLDNPLNFEDTKFKETNRFNQEIIVDFIEEDDNSVFLNAIIIGYNKSIIKTTYEVDKKSTNPLFIKTIKNMNFGDFLKINGKINYKVLKTEIDGAFGKQFINDYKKSLEIVGADEASFIPKAYTESDLYESDESFEDIFN